MTNLDTICARIAAAQPQLRTLLASREVQAAAAALGFQPHQLAALATASRPIFQRLCPGADQLYQQLHDLAGPFEAFNTAGADLIMSSTAPECECQVPGGSPFPPQTQPAPPTVPPATDPCAPGVPPSLTPMDFNCRPSASDMVPCRAARVMSEESIFDVEAAWQTGELFSGGVVATLIPAVGLASRLCIDSIGVSLNGTALPLTWIALQAQILTLDANGNAVQAWTSYVPARPGQISATDGRCPCARVCVCQGYASIVRVLFRVPALTGTDELTVTLGGYREDWGVANCGPCPPCRQCDLVALSAAELAAGTAKFGIVYVPEGV